MKVIKGAEVTAGIQAEIEEELKQLGGYIPTLAVVRVGERPDDMSYEKNAISRMKKFGMGAVTFTYPESVSWEEFSGEFQRINQDDSIDGILLLRPLPPHLREKELERMILPEKDVDGISPENIAKVFSGDKSGFAPCTAEAVMEVLNRSGIQIAGKRAVVIGRSMVVGRPLAMMLLAEHATVTVCHTRTKDLEQTCRQGEILVAAAGRAGMVTEEFIGDGAAVIDVGINVNEEGRLCGDVDFQRVSDSGKAGALTPVPGGVGGVTTAVLGKHLVRAAAEGMRKRGKR